MKKIAIIGASYLQEPLIQKAKSRDVETHVFAWACDDIGESSADHFYPISIVEKDKILDKCREIGIDAVCSIGSDLAIITVNYIAERLGLVGNSVECTRVYDSEHIVYAIEKALQQGFEKKLSLRSTFRGRSTALNTYHGKDTMNFLL